MNLVFSLYSVIVYMIFEYQMSLFSSEQLTFILVMVDCIGPFINRKLTTAKVNKFIFFLYFWNPRKYDLGPFERR